MATNDDEIRMQLARSRQDRGAASAAGYRTPTGADQAVVGDERGPFIRTPPFPNRVERLDTIAVLPRNNSAYAFTPDIDVAKNRIINVFFTWVTTVALPNFQLSVVPEYRPNFSEADDAALAPGAWPMVAIDPTVNVQTLTTPFTAGFASRTFYPAEFRSPVLTGPFTYRWAMPFQVTSADRFRLGVVQIDNVGDSSLQMWWQAAT